MRHLLPTVEQWQQEGKRVALATVVKVYGSAPQPVGAKMAVSARGEMVGSVSGGCVEAAVVQEALQVLAKGTPRLIPYGISNEAAWEVGLACGGTIEVFVEPLVQDDLYRAWVRALKDGQLVAVVTVLTGPEIGHKVLVPARGEPMGTVRDAALWAGAVARARDLMSTHRSARVALPQAEGGAEVLVDIFPPPPKLIVVGAVHIAIPLVTFARELGFRTYVVDARTAFATRDRFPHVDDLVIGWPQDVLPRLGLDEGTYVVVLSHDEKIDNPALKVALEHPVRYVGALGSRKTHARRVAALRAMGVPEEAIARIHAPIGLDIGARRPEEIAVAIIAEIVAVSNGRG